jgi:hypothetical protein
LAHAERDGAERRSTKPRNTVTIRVAVTQDPTFDRGELGAQVRRDQVTLRRPNYIFDLAARPRGGAIQYYESEETFTDMVGQMTTLGVSEVVLQYPFLEGRAGMVEHMTRDVLPTLRAAHGTQFQR